MQPHRSHHPRVSTQSLICFISKFTALNTRSHFSCFQLSGIQHDHQTLLDRIGKIALQSFRLLLLHRASARANYISSRRTSCFGRGVPRESMTRVCGGVSTKSWESVILSARTLLAQRRPFLLLWAVWASEALYGQGPVPSGRVGRIASPWFSRGALIWWLISWMS